VAQSSQAVFSIIPMQDILGLGNEARMNTPSQVSGNWAWRYLKAALSPELAKKLADLAYVTDRQPR
jgi:4-alpha-glucanotransferase